MKRVAQPEFFATLTEHQKNNAPFSSALPQNTNIPDGTVDELQVCGLSSCEGYLNVLHYMAGLTQQHTLAGADTHPCYCA